MKSKKIYDPKWNFAEGSMNEINHLMHPYPAMLMPLIIRELLNTYGKGSNTMLYDPYVGSGTTLVEGMYYGVKEAVGVDLNPLAILISKGKTTNYDINQLNKAIIEFSDKDHVISDYSIDRAYSFSIRDSWFIQKNIIELDYLKKYIDMIDDEKIKLYFTIAFSQVVRSVSLTRNGEFKLYRIPPKQVALHNPDAIKEFKNLLKSNLELVMKAHQVLNYDSKIKLFMMDSTDFALKEDNVDKYDLIITSPPYGDSHTTVAYGQFSRLANEWIGLHEPATLDRRLFGGSNKVEKDYVFGINELDEVIALIKQYDLTQESERHSAVISFYKDYLKSIDAISKTVKNDGYVIYVVGNRRVRNYEMPTDIITVKAFEKNGYFHVKTIVRDILNKRMPSKASPDNRAGGQISTMTKEYIVIMKKVA